MGFPDGLTLENPMPDLGELIGRWGYLAIFLVVVLGNVGLPLPEEAILVLAGYLVWRRRLRLPIVLAVGIVSAVAGDNLGYWIGRRYGREAIERYGQWVLVTPQRREWMWRLVARHGPVGVFAARFIPGLRAMAGPLAGAAGLGLLRFVVANVLGAAMYVPYAVGLGYAVGYGLGDYVERLRRVVGEIEHLILGAVIICAVASLGWRVLRALRARVGS